MQKIACLGPEGTFTSVALGKYMEKRGKYEVVYANSIRGVVDRAKDADIDFSFCPIENSIEGDVSATLDRLAFCNELFITGEYVMDVHQHLLAKKGTKETDIKAIFSHPQALGQCANFLEQKFPDADIIQTASTATAAQMAMKGEGRAAAIGGLDLMKYGLEIVRRDIQDNAENSTRFVTIGKKPAVAGKDAKTSIVFAAQHRAGELFRMLSIFNIFDINLLSISSRPAKTVLGEYLFFVDLEGDASDEGMEKALNLVKEKSLFYRNLGSY